MTGHVPLSALRSATWPFRHFGSAEAWVSPVISSHKADNGMKSKRGYGLVKRGFEYEREKKSSFNGKQTYVNLCAMRISSFMYRTVRRDFLSRIVLRTPEKMDWFGHYFQN